MKPCAVCNQSFRGIKYCSTKCAYGAMKLKAKLRYKHMREKITYNKETGQHEINGIRFDGHFLEWKFEYVPKTYLKQSDLSGDEYRKGGTIKIFLNGDCVFDDFCRTEDMAMKLINKHLHELKCHFELLGVNINNWKEEIVGKKVYHAGVPSIVASYVGDGEIILRTEDGKPYEIYGHQKEYPEDEDEWYDKDRVHITDTRIYWHRK